MKKNDWKKLGGAVLSVTAALSLALSAMPITSHAIRQEETGTYESTTVVKECGDAASLQRLLNAAEDGDIIKITNNFQISRRHAARIKENCLVTVDLDGKTISMTLKERLDYTDYFGVGENSALLFMDGTVERMDTRDADRGILIMSNVKTNWTWLGYTRTWAVNNCFLQGYSTEHGILNPDNPNWHTVESGQQAKEPYNYENTCPAMVGTAANWSLFETIEDCFDKMNSDTANNDKIIVLADTSLRSDVSISAADVIIDLSNHTLTTNNRKFALTNYTGTSLLRNGTLNGALDLTTGFGDITLENMVIRGDVKGDKHNVSINGGYYNNIIGGTGRQAGMVKIPAGFYKGNVTGEYVEITGGYFVNKPNEAYLPTGYVIENCNVNVDGTKYGFRVVPAVTITQYPSAADMTYGQKLSESKLSGGKAVYGKQAVSGTFSWNEPDTVPEVADSMTTNYDVVFSPDSYDYAEVTFTMKVVVNKADSVVKEPPSSTGKIKYTGDAHPLINPGVAEGGTMEYALGTSKDTPPEEGWDSEIPTAVTPGTYWLWYRVKGDANHNDTPASF